MGHSEPLNRSVASVGRPATGFVLLLLAGAQPLHAQKKTDAVTLENGDAITGEIRGLDRGKLEYRTDDMGTIEIEWNKIERVASISFFQVEVRSGRTYFGNFSEEAELGTLIVAVSSNRETLSLASIVRIQPIRLSFWRQLDGFVDVGFNYARANRNTQLTASTRAGYRGRWWGGTARGETYFQTQTNADETTRNSASFSLERFFQQSLWSALFFTAVEQNTELKLAIRGRFGGGVFRTMHQSNRSIVRMAGGVSLSAERFTADGPILGAGNNSALSLEGVILFEWAVFRFDAPELDMLTEVKTFPSITDLGRVRSDVDIRIKYELVKDFFLSLTGNLRLDSRPPSTDATKLDFGTKFTIGWSF